MVLSCWLWYVTFDLHESSFQIPLLLTDGDQIATIGSGVSVSVQAGNGLGRDILLLTEDQILAYQKVSGLVTGDYIDVLLIYFLGRICEQAALHRNSMFRKVVHHLAAKDSDRIKTTSDLRLATHRLHRFLEHPVRTCVCVSVRR